MSIRPIPLVNDETYHVFNRSIAKRPIFLSVRDYERALALIDFYRFSKPSLRFSHFKRLDTAKKLTFLDALKNTMPQIKILAFTLMPNHFHFLIRQTKENGIIEFMKLFQESYAKYHNIIANRTGSVFQALFKAVRIESEEQLLHVFRYIHLNPLTSFLLKDLKELEKFRWGSYKDYVENKEHQFVNTTYITQLLGSKTKIREFTSDQIDYQRELQNIKHLTFE